MHRTAPKCEHCRKAYQQVKVSQKYCSHRCRQAAYHRRKQAIKHGNAMLEKPAKTNVDKVHVRLSPAICEHCHGSFWAKSKRATYCSTSCRVMHHRAMRSAIPNALALIYGLPADKALDLLETQPISRIKATLTDCGWIWSGQRRAWVQQIEMMQT